MGNAELPRGMSNAELSNLMNSMPGAALMAAAAAAAQGLNPHGLPPGLAGLGLPPGSLPPSSISGSLLPFLMGVSTSAAMSNTKNSSPSPSTPGGGGSIPPGLPHMFPYMDSNPLAAAYYNSLIPSSSASSTLSSLSAAHQAVQMAHLNSLGLGGGGGLPAGLLSSPPMGGPSNSGVSPEALANLGMYKNFLGNAAAAATSSGGNVPPAHFLAALMSPGGPKPKK
jgi:hypothetical protein